MAILVGLLVLGLPTGAAQCPDSLCLTDEDAGKTDSPRTEGAPHAPRYRYVNASAKAGESDLFMSLTFACESNGLREEWFYGNVTDEDSQRRDEIQSDYSYGEIFHDTCNLSIVVNPDQVVFYDAHRSWYGNHRCPHTEETPSVVSLLP